eukprot:m.586709 g.586709  ORF g.586709 m.586709 type:complete len:642 (-) comp22347_c0_seq5:2173-4098(-)
MYNIAMTSHARSLWKCSAQDVVELLKNGTVTPLDAVEAALKRIECTNADVNAMCAVYADAARARALSVSTDTLLAGLPIVVKDTLDVEGMITTHGSKLWEQNVAASTDAIVAAIEANGGIVIGKTNTPEFAAGSNTFNDVFGTTSTPFDTRRTSGGSSGGTAAALACGQGWLGLGSDLGGSLRIPASYCGIVGFRTSANLVRGSDVESEAPDVPVALRCLQGINGPMARSVGDVALCMDAYAVPPSGTLEGNPAASCSAGGPLGGDSTAQTQQGTPQGNISWLECTRSGPLPNRILWTPDLGVCHVDPETVRVCKVAVDVLQRALAGEHQTPCFVTDTSVDTPEQERVSAIFAKAEHTFRTLRGYFFSQAFLDLPPFEPQPVATDTGTDDLRFSQQYSAHIAKAHPEFAQTVKPEVLWNIGVGLQVLHNTAIPIAPFSDIAGESMAVHPAPEPKVKPMGSTNLESGRTDVDIAASNHQALLQGFTTLMQEYDLLCTPCVVCPPFDKKLRYISQITHDLEGRAKINQFSNYTEWLRMTYAITLTTAPALSLPVGFTEKGLLPIGLQIVGPPGGDAAVLRAATILERALEQQGFCTGSPCDPVTTATSEISVTGCIRTVGPHTAAEAQQAHDIEIDTYFQHNR